MQPTNITWESYSPGVFSRAQKEDKFVLLDLEAVWCHWCHVMDQITYSDPQVIALINEKYIAVKVDQDSRPDISNRYEDYGWPATVIFNADGGEIAIRQGYVPPMPMIRMLQAIIDDPTPGPSVRAQKPIQFGTESALPPKLLAELKERFDDNYDAKHAGWGNVHKYLDWDAIEYSMGLARHGDKEAEQRARQTIDGTLKLIDPAWGGIYQYSTDDDWDHPHFEKIMQFQAEGIRVYAMAYAQWKDPKYLRAAQEIRRYLASFLADPEGAFYTSQDADLVDGEHSASYFALDDTGRRELGIPRIDRHVYARENGWAIEGLVELYDVDGDSSVLKDAIRAAEWNISHRWILGGGFHHGEKDAGGPYLGDTLTMARAFLSLYSATTDRVWLGHAEAAADFIATQFSPSEGIPGFITTKPAAGLSSTPRQELDENIAATRFFNLLFRYTGRPAFRTLAKSGMRFLATPRIAEAHGPWGAGILLAGAEMLTEPLHVTIVGPKHDSNAGALFKEALRCPDDYKRVEWWDPGEAPLPNPDVTYPKLKFAAAFVCTNNTCSSPMRDVSILKKKLSS